MKKTALYILIGVAAIFALLYILEKTDTKIKIPFLGKDNTEPAAAALQPKDFTAAKMQVSLHNGQTLYPLETELLQRFLNAYGVAVPVTGIYDEATEKAVTQITGKGATTLREIRYKYMVTANLNTVADEIQKGARAI